MRAVNLSCIVLLTAAILLPAPVRAQTGAAGEPAGDAALPLAPERDEVNGTCRSPRQAWLQLIWWAGGFGGERDFVRAAACFDTAGIDDGEREAPRLARRLLEHLDANNLRIDTKNPAIADPDYVDPATNTHVYRDPAAPEFALVKQADGRWLFSADALAAIPAPGRLSRAAERLPPWFQSQFLGVQVWSYVGILVLFLVALVVQRITVFIMRTYVRRLIRRSDLRYLHSLVDRADRPIGGLTMAWVFYLGVPMLAFPLTASNIALVATKALAAYSMVWLGYRLIDVVGDWLEARAEATSTKLDDQLVPLVTKSLKVIVSVLGGIFVLQNLDVDVSSLLAGVGLGGLAFALAAKDTVANFFGSVTIFVDRPFQIGDWVVVGGVEGVVEEVGFRTSRIRTFYNSLVTMPNSLMSNTAVDNYGAREYRRYTTTLGLTYDTPPEKVQAFCEAVRGAIVRLDGMRKDYYLVEFKEFGPSSLNIMLYCFMKVATWNDELRVKSQLNLEILRIARELGVSFAFPTQTIHVETLAKLGESRPSHTGPTELNALAGVVQRFAPGGELARTGFDISPGYDCRKEWFDEDGNRKTMGGGAAEAG